MTTAEWVAVAFAYGPLLVGALFSGMFLLAGVRLLRSGLAVARSDPIPAAEVYNAEDAVEVEGVAEPAVDTLEAPASGEECLAYVDERQTRTGRGGADWTTVERNRDVVPFYVADDSGEVLVDGDAELDLYLDDETFVGGDHERHRERRIDPGEPVHVYGQRCDLVEARGGFPDERVYVGGGEHVDQVRVTAGTERTSVLPRLLVGAALTLISGFFLALIARSVLVATGVL